MRTGSLWSPVSAPRTFSFQVVRVATLMKYSRVNAYPIPQFDTRERMYDTTHEQLTTAQSVHIEERCEAAQNDTDGGELLRNTGALHSPTHVIAIILQYHPTLQ